MKRKAEDDILVFNVGGNKTLSTTKNTLINSKNDFPDSLLSTMFSASSIEMVPRDKKQRYFIDYDGETFRHILNVIRDPSLMEDIPPNTSYEAWWRALGYWGLVDKKKRPEVEEVENKPYEVKSLTEIGETIKREIMENEAVVIKAVLEKSGYYSSLGKDRSRVIHIPIDGGYQLPWGCDIGVYIDTHQKSVQKLLEQMMGGSCTVRICKSVTKTHKISYLFDGKEYNTTDKHMSISLEFSFNLKMKSEGM
jgi:hypothetical protein